MQVEVDLDMNAHANARAWHGDRKARTVKQQKTIEANKKALAVADKKVQIQLSKVHRHSEPFLQDPSAAQVQASTQGRTHATKLEHLLQGYRLASVRKSNSGGMNSTPIYWSILKFRGCTTHHQGSTLV